MSDAQRWDARWSAQNERGRPSPLLTQLAPVLPVSGRALDLAGGLGRHAAWLGARGLDTTLADISPVALARAPEGVKTLRFDAADGPPEGPWNFILVHHFLDRALLSRLPEVLAPGGMLLVIHPTVRNLERHARPSRRWLLLDGELPSLVTPLQVLHYSEEWRSTGRYEAICLGQHA